MLNVGDLACIAGWQRPDAPAFLRPPQLHKLHSRTSGPTGFWMRVGGAGESLSRHAPIIVIVVYCVSLASAWSGVPDWLPQGLAVLVAALALLLFAAKRRRYHRDLSDGGDSPSEKSWIEHELAGAGSPAGSYLLAFFGVLSIVLTGIQTAPALLAWAGLALGIAWGATNARYPTDG